MKNAVLILLAFFFPFFVKAQCPTVYTLSGSGTYCGGTGITVMLSNSDVGTIYQLYDGYSTVGSPIAGAGFPINFGTFTTTVDLTVNATLGSCTLPMSGTAIIRNEVPSPMNPVSVCRGGITGTFDSCYTRGHWSSSNWAIARLDTFGGGFSYCRIYGDSVGTANVTYTVASACGTLSSTCVVTVDTVSSPASITGPTNVCQGAHIFYSASASSGYWLSSAASIATIISSTGELVGLSSGSATISYVHNGPCGTVVSTIGVTVSAGAFSANIAAPFAMYPGTTDSASVTGASGGTWSSGYGGFGTVSSTGIITALTPGSYSLCYNFTASCGSTSVNTTIDIVDTSVHLADSFYVTSSVSCGSLYFTAFSVRFLSTLRLKTYYGDGFIDTTMFMSSFRGIDTARHNYSASGTYTIKHILMLGSVAIDSITYSQIVATTAVPVISGSSVIIVGTNDTMAVTGGIGGHWYSSAPSIASINASTGFISGLLPGDFNVNYYNACFHSIFGSTVVPVGTFIRDSFFVYSTSNCSGPLFHTRSTHAAAGRQVKTYYGDGTFNFHTLSATLATDTFSHAYASSGTYTIKHVLLNGSSPIDSISYAYHYLSCHDITISLFDDANGNCIFETGIDFSNTVPVQIEIDSSGVVIDTVSVTSGLFYHAYGSTGDFYRFRILSPCLYMLCPSSGLLSDTLTTVGYSSSNFNTPLAFYTSSAYDLMEYATQNVGRHSIVGDAYINNPYSDSTSAILTMHFDSRYSFYFGRPSPTTTSAGSATWFISLVSGSSTPTHIYYHLEVPGGTTTWLTPTDTVRTTFTVTPTAGDIDTTSNFISRLDTVKASYDPNYTAVSPEGNILNGTKLHYTIHFENDGNDTAQNIYVLDTLSDNVDPSTLNIEAATAAMYISFLHYGSHTVVKFDFPGIKLPDSSHHNQCTGFVMFNVKTRTGLADGTTTLNGAGIYFDDNPVVMTNKVTNTIVVPAISIATASGSVCYGDTVHFTATPHSVGNTHYQWYVNTTAIGTDNVAFASHSLTTGDVVKCKMTAIQDDTVTVLSNTITMTVNPIPVAGTISGPTSVCTGDTITLTSSGSAGTWSLSNTHASQTGGIVVGVTAGNDTLTHDGSTACGAAVTHVVITVSPIPVAGTISGPTSVCMGDTIVLTSSGSAGTWSLSNTHASNSGGVILGISAGIDTVLHDASTACGTAISHSVITINPIPVAGIISGPTSVCPGDTIMLTSSGSAGTWSLSNSHATNSGGMVVGVTAGNDTLTHDGSTVCGTAITHAVITINPIPVAGTISGPSAVCMGDTIVLTSSGSAGTWSLSNANASHIGGVILGVSAGMDTVTLDASTACGSAITHTVITVNPIPIAGTISGPTSVCTGDTITLTSSGSAGTWSLSNTHASQTGGIVVGVTAGNDTLTHDGSTACGTAITHAVITVNATLTPSITISASPTGSVCSGDTVNFVATPVNGGTAPAFSWIISGTATAATGSTFSYPPVIGDVVTCNLTSSIACPTAPVVSSAGITMTVIPSVTPTLSIVSSVDSITSVGQTVTFYGTPSYGGTTATYQWFLNGAPVAGATTLTFTLNVYENDTVYCLMTGNPPCATSLTATSNTKIVYANYLSVNDLRTTIGNLSLFPNPNNGGFTLSGEVETNGTISYEIFDVTGRMINSGTTQPTKGKIEQRINLDKNTPPGMNLLKLDAGNQRELMHFSVVR